MRGAVFDVHCTLRGLLILSCMHFVPIAMASSDVLSGMEIKPELQEVEIESIPVEMPVDSVEGTQMIAFQSLHEPGGEEIILQTQEEIVGDGAEDLNYDLQVPTEAELDLDYGSANFKRSISARRRQTALKAGRCKNDYAYADGSSKKWEQKQVQIKTLEGEFSVTMWSSGADDGELMFSALFFVLMTLGAVHQFHCDSCSYLPI